MRLPSFLQPRSPARVIYWSATPLFDFRVAEPALRDGRYRHVDSEPDLQFRREDTHYAMTGGQPGTVALIPIPSLHDTFVFQQSDGVGVAFYGAMRFLDRADAFLLLSPERAAVRALAAARAAGATITRGGCMFALRGELLSALVSVAQEARAEAWNLYRLQ